MHRQVHNAAVFLSLPRVLCAIILPAHCDILLLLGVLDLHSQIICGPFADTGNVCLILLVSGLV